MNEQRVYNLLKDKGFTDAQVAGIMGNIAVETGGTFSHTQKQKGGNGYGLFQFDDKKKNYFEYLAKNELDDSPEAQIDFMYETIYGNEQDVVGRGNAKKIREALDNQYPEDIAVMFMKEWEKPGVEHEDRRMGEAVKYFNFPPVKEEEVDLSPQGFERSIK